MARTVMLTRRSMEKKLELVSFTLIGLSLIHI